MRCAHVIPYMAARAGGPVVVVDRLCRQIARRGVEPIVLTTDVLSDMAPRPAWSSISRVGGAGARGGEYELRAYRAWSRRFAYSPALASALDRIIPTCDLVHVHTLWTHATAAAVRACRRHRVPYVLMPHGMLDPNSLSRKSLRKIIYGHLFEFQRVRSAAGVIYTTERERELAERSVGTAGSGPPVYVVPLGADEPPGDRDGLAREFLASRPFLAGKQIVTYLSRVHPKKGLDLLVPAFAKVAARMPQAHLLIVGPDEADTWPRVRRQIEQLGLQPHVTRIDMLMGAAKWAALAASTLFVLPSYQENFAIAVAEALRIGTPVVISDRVNIWPTVEAGRAGRVVPCDADALTAAIHVSLADEAAWRDMSAAAVMVATRNYDWGKTADAMMEVYQRVLHCAGVVSGWKRAPVSPRLDFVPEYRGSA
jgi:glycosyltransferase involved in cell wall biosynthesis